MTKKNFKNLLQEVKKSAKKNSLYILASYFIFSLVVSVASAIFLFPIFSEVFFESPKGSETVQILPSREPRRPINFLYKNGAKRHMLDPAVVAQRSEAKFQATNRSSPPQQHPATKQSEISSSETESELVTKNITTRNDAEDVTPNITTKNLAENPAPETSKITTRNDDAKDVTKNITTKNFSPATSPATLKNFFESFSVKTFFCVFLMLEFFFIMVYGFCDMLFQMQREKFVTLGFLFNGFRGKNRFKKSASISAFFSLVILVAIFFSRTFTFLLKNNFFGIKDFFYKIFFSHLAENHYQLSSDFEIPFLFLFFVAILFLALAFLILLPYSFSFFCSIENSFDENFGLKKSLKKSRTLLKRQKISFLKFVILAGGKNLFFAIISNIFIQMLSAQFLLSGEKNFLTSILIFAIELFYFFNAFAAFSKMALAHPFFYSTLNFLKKNSEIQKNKTEKKFILKADDKIEIEISSETLKKIANENLCENENSAAQKNSLDNENKNEST